MEDSEEIKILKSKYPFLFDDKVLFPFELGGSFIPLKIKLCNGQYNYSFSEADVVVRAYHVPTTQVRNAVTDGYVFMGVISGVINGQTDHIKKLGHFFTAKEHINCLTRIRQETEKLSESTLQAVLAVHLFEPLMSHSNAIVDANRYMGQADTKCKYCGLEVITQDTSFGNSDIWHGYGDILLEHNVVKVEKETEQGDSEAELDSGETEDYSFTQNMDEPAAKRMKTEILGAGSGNAGGSRDEYVIDSYMPDGPTKITFMDLDVQKSNKMLSQVLAQTIVNAFLQVKLNPELNECFIPSFLASDKHVTIHMYNPAYDHLLTQDKAMPLWTAGSLSTLDDLTILSIWMALNMHSFPSSISCHPDNAEFFGKSDFHQLIAPEKLVLYKEKLEMPLKRHLGRQGAYKSDIRKSYDFVQKEVEKLFKSKKMS